MSENIYGRDTEVQEYECTNCGHTLVEATDDVEICHECCDHENTRDTLGGELCEDCGSTL